MKWNQKGILVCILLFVVVLGVMMGQTMGNGTKSEDTTYASEEDMVSLSGAAKENPDTVTGKAVKPVAEKKTEKKEGKTARKKEKARIVTKPASSPSVKPASDKKTSGDKRDQKKKKEKHPGATAMPTKKPTVTTSSTKPRENTVHFDIQCKAIMDKQSLWKEGIEEIIPKSGVFYSGECSFTPGETVYDVLKRICKEQGIAMDSVYTPLYGTYYVKGIGNLYEFDCGSESGWLYSVNGVTPGVGSSQYKVQSQDKIVFFYDYEY